MLMTLKVFRLVFPPRLIGSPFVMYDGANRALKVSRASVTRFAPARALEATGPDDLCAGESKKLNDAVIGRTMERDSGCGKGFTEGREPTIASAVGDRQRDPQGERSYPHLVKSAPCCRTFSIFASPETLGATQSGYRCEENQRAAGLSSTEICKPKRSVSETPPPKT